MGMTLKEIFQEAWPGMLILLLIGIGLVVFIREDFRQSAACRDRGGVMQQSICFDPKVLK